MELFAEKIRLRFENKFQKGSKEECWEWQGAKTTEGYGLFWPERRTTWTAHRYMFVLEIEDIPSGYQVHHVCYNKGCVNPFHLQLLSPKENTQDAFSTERVPTCRHGHERIPENLYYRKDGRKDCLLCRKERNKGDR